MRGLAAAMLVVATVLRAAAGDRRPSPPIEAISPGPPAEHSACTTSRGVVPVTVTINGAASICDLDERRFTDRDAFVAHLRTAHHTAPARIPDLLLVRDGRSIL